MAILVIIAGAAAAYLMGSIPTGYLIVKWLKGLDIRSVGSGNIGATNVKRVLGLKWFFGVLFLDALKGFLPVLAVKLLFPQYQFLPVLAALCAVLGHTFTIFLNFKGGKGVATGLGVFLALAPLSVICSLASFVIILFMFKYISLGSIVAAVLLPAFVFIFGENGFLNLVLLFSVFTAVFVVYKHKENISRLREGTENKFTVKSEKKEDAAQPENKKKAVKK
ncbi:MAG: Glycerol-3-phosphate acyltransferase [Candidatus Aerophobetes bacterium ADurb.Bin490]|nr:MAG: Glycerol-3-phosphate acyltransferase [Candidatus Aerophobetes bacterium ADurb.Bin490]